MPISDKTPLGKPLPPVGDAVLANPDESEIALLIAQWNRYAPPFYRGLLEAENVVQLRLENREPKGSFVWDPTEEVYIHVETGKKITRELQHEAFSAFVENYAREGTMINFSYEIGKRS